MIEALKSTSSDAWLSAVLTDFDRFLLDHAANERKASSMAMSMVAHYPDKDRLLAAMIDLALEELNHFRQVVKIVRGRGLLLAPDEKDPYVNQLLSNIRRGAQHYFLDRLLSAAVIEARGAERFALLARHIEDEKLKVFYATLASSEAGHHLLFIELADHYFCTDEVKTRLHDWLTIEKTILEELPVRARLH
jgi:tRNA 2-(methylsulfanyl)-N6-isopentenyladenosine37 hydroxylase